MCVYTCVYAYTYTPSSLIIYYHTHKILIPLPLVLLFPSKQILRKQVLPSPLSKRELMEEGESCSARRELTALVVDDQEVLRRIHGRLLKDVGVSHVEAAGNGKEAVDIHRGGQSFDLILMDLDMPVMNGIQATRELRAMGVRSKIAGVSARNEGEGVKEFKEAGLDLLFPKPLTTLHLSSLVTQINPL